MNMLAKATRGLKVPWTTRPVMHCKMSVSNSCADLPSTEVRGGASIGYVKRGCQGLFFHTPVR